MPDAPATAAAGAAKHTNLWAVTVRVGPLTGRGVSVTGWDAAADGAAAAALRSLRATRVAELAAYDARATAAAGRSATLSALAAPADRSLRVGGGAAGASSLVLAPPSAGASSAAALAASAASDGGGSPPVRPPANPPQLGTSPDGHASTPPPPFPLTAADVMDVAALTAGARLPATTASAVADAAAAVATADRAWRDVCAQVGDRTAKLWAARRVSGLGGVASPALARGSAVGVASGVVAAAASSVTGAAPAANTGDLTAAYEAEMARGRVAARAAVVGVRDNPVAGRVHWWRAVVGEYVRRHGVDAALLLVDCVEVARSRQQQRP